MRRILAFISFICLTAASALGQSAVDFSGEWKLNVGRSEIEKLPSPPETLLRVDQSAASVSVWASPGGGGSPKSLLYPLDGRTEKRNSGDISSSTQTKWEGSALLANTIVTGAGRNYTIMERWKVSSNGSTLTIRRTIVDKGGESESTLVYESRAAAAANAQAAPPAPVEIRPRPTLASVRAERAVEASAGPRDEDFVIASGTRVLLQLRNAVDTKHSAPGDRVYLETSYPVYVNQHLVVPQGSYVMGTITEALRPGKVKGKAAMNIRFDSITLPNGITRDFRSSLGSADGKNVDHDEGRITGESGKGSDARTVGATTAAGAGIGTIAGAARNAPLKGLGIGAAAGGAAGLIGVLMSRGPEVVLRPGTSVEMVLDRDIRFTADELSRWER